MRKITDIIIHCSATVEGVNVSAATIDTWHRRRGFNSIGYHYVISIDGTIQSGRPVSVAGAHCVPNSNSIGICYVGGLDANKKAKDTRTEKQKAALIKILRTLKNIFPKAAIRGHRDMSKDKDGDGVEKHEYMKMCPCFDAELEYLELQPKGFKAKSKVTKDKMKKDEK